MSSTSNSGRAKGNVCVEYLGEGGIMELSSNRPRKKIIDCITPSGSFSNSESQWFLTELCSDQIGIEFFDTEEDYDSQNYRDILSWCTTILNCSPSARLMLKEACEKDWKIMLEDLQGGDYYIDVDQKLLIIDNNALVPSALARSNYFRNMTLVTLTKALRDIWQEKRHGGFDELYSPEHILFMERVRTADLDVTSILVAWELRSEDYPELWRHMIGSGIGDMAMSFSGFLERDPTSQFNGQGLVATFKQWFRCAGRIDACDHNALEYMDDVLTLCDVVNPFGKRKPTKMNIEVLSCLPDKTAYLQGLGTDILSDPIYSSVDNEFNQTHLFHIMHDLEAVVVENVPFRDVRLARKIFPVETI